MLRKDVDKNLTWNLDDLAKDSNEFDELCKKSIELSKKFYDNYCGKIKTDEDVINSLKDYNELEISKERPSYYMSLFFSEDGTNPEAHKIESKFGVYYQQINENSSFYIPELLELDTKILENVYDEVNVGKSFLRDLLRIKKHQPEKAVSIALSKLMPVFDGPYSTYEIAKSSDIRFPSFEVDGKEYEMTFGYYEDRYESSPDTNLRRKAFEVFHKELSKYQNIFADNYNTYLQANKAKADIYGFSSIFDYMLLNQNIEREIYDAHIDALEKYLPVVMRKYAKKVAKSNKLDKMTYADLKASIYPGYVKNITVEESKNYIKDGLSILGEDYVNYALRSIDERWIDFVENEGKSTGAFCASPYRIHPYILISWSGKMDDVFVLAHEMGHGGHFHLAGENNSYLDHEPSLYLIEAPSTCNEMLLSNYMINNSEDKKFISWVNSQMIERTYYHNFVTHGIEAIFQRRILRKVDKYEKVTANIMNEEFRDILNNFWGEDVEILEGSELTWMRQPHYFMGLYPYTYQAGLSMATEIFKKLQTKDPAVLNNYIDLLKSGNQYSPLEWAEKLDIQITDGKSIKSTIEFIDEIIDRIDI